MQDNNVDDLVKNRKQNINLQNFFVKPESIHFFKARPSLDFYARNTCIHNNEFTIDERLKSYNGSGSSGVVRDGEYISASTGIIKKASIKVVIANKRNIARDLLELKLGIEAYKLIPNCVVEIEFINKCDLLTSTALWPDETSSTNEILIIGMEKGTNNLRVELNKHINDVIKFKKVISKALTACDKFNKYGFLHRDIKLENIIIVNRNGNESPVLIDFGLTTYMTNVNNLIDGRIVDTNLSTYQNPPLDSFYLCLHLSTYNKYIYLKSIIFDLTYKYYTIIRKLGIDDSLIKSINKSTFDNYKLEIPMDLFVNSIPFVLFSKGLFAYPTYEPDPNERPRLTTNIILKINSVKIIDFSFDGIKNIFSHNSFAPAAFDYREAGVVRAPASSRTTLLPRGAECLFEVHRPTPPSVRVSSRSSPLKAASRSFKLQSLYNTPLSHSVRKTGSSKASRSPPKAASRSFKLQSLYNTPLSHSIKKSGPL